MGRIALKLFSAAGTAFLIFLLGVALSGGGLTRGILPDPLNTAVAAVVWLAALAMLPLLVAAGIAGILAIAQPPRAARRGRARRQFRTPRRDASLAAVLFVLAIGAIGLMLATRTPSPDQVPFGVALLALAVVALAVVLWDRIAGFLRR